MIILLCDLIIIPYFIYAVIFLITGQNRRYIGRFQVLDAKYSAFWGSGSAFINYYGNQGNSKVRLSFRDYTKYPIGSQIDVWTSPKGKLYASSGEIKTKQIVALAIILLVILGCTALGLLDMGLIDINI
jgi:hypothetical protein